MTWVGLRLAGLFHLWLLSLLATRDSGGRENRASLKEPLPWGSQALRAPRWVVVSKDLGEEWGARALVLALH